MQTGRAALVVGPIALAALSALAACGGDAAAAFGGLVEFVVEPPCAHRVARMDLGALQHVDRSYTYDVVPGELVGGALLQGVHRPPAGTRVTFELAASARVYVFFHATVDGGPHGDVRPRLRARPSRLACDHRRPRLLQRRRPAGGDAALTDCGRPRADRRRAPLDAPVRRATIGGLACRSSATSPRSCSHSAASPLLPPRRGRS